MDKLNNDFKKTMDENSTKMSQELSTRQEPVMYLMDNINIYRGRRTHLRVYQTVLSNQWNLTGHAILRPQIDSALKEMLKKPSFHPQKDPLKIEDPTEIFAEDDPQWKSYVDSYLKNILSFVLFKLLPGIELNAIGPSQKKLNSLLLKKY